MKSLCLSGVDFRNSLLSVKSQTITIPQALSRINLTPYEYHILSQEDCELLLNSSTRRQQLPADVISEPHHYFWFLHTVSGELIFVEPAYYPHEIVYLAEPMWVKLGKNAEHVYLGYDQMEAAYYIKDGYAKVEARDLKAKDARFFVRIDKVECIQLWRFSEDNALRHGYPSLNEFRIDWVHHHPSWQSSSWVLQYHYSLTAKPAIHVHKTEAQER